MSQSPPSTGDPLPSQALGLSLQRILASPLSALRASIESVAAELDRGLPAPGARLDGALEELTRLAHDVEALVELAAPRTLAPTRCSMDEIVRAALRGLSAGERARVRCAEAEPQLALQVDGPLLSRCLTYLLQSALAGVGDEVLLRGSREGGHAVFAIVRSGARMPLLPDRIDPTQGREALTRAVRVVAAERDLERMGACLSVHPPQQGMTSLRIELDADRPTGREESR